MLTVRVGGHSKLWFEGDDLHMRLPITVLEAYRGAKIDVDTPQGGVQLGVPAGAQSGAKLRLREKGAKAGKKIGDLIVHLEVRLPKKRNEEVEKALEAVEKHFEGDVRESMPRLS